MSRNRLTTDGADGNIEVAAVLDFQRFVSDSGRLSVEFDEEAAKELSDEDRVDTVINRKKPGFGTVEGFPILALDEEPNPSNTNMMLNRYSVGANLANLMGRTSVGDLEFKHDDSNADDS